MKEIKLIVDTAQSTENLEELLGLLDDLKKLIDQSDGSNFDELKSAFDQVQSKIKVVGKDVKQLDKDIDSLNQNEVKVDVDTTELDGLQEQIVEVEDSLDKRIELAIEAAESATTVGEVRQSLRELQTLSLEIGDVTSSNFNRVAEAAGNLKDRVSDTQEAFNTFSGKPITDLSRGIGGLRSAFLNLDFEGFNEQATRLSQISKQLSFAELGKQTKALTTSFGQLGKTLLTNPIFILGTAIALIVINFDKLAKAGGLVGTIFSGLGEIIEVLTDLFTSLTDAIGLTGIAAQEEAERSIDANNSAIDSIEDRISAQEQLEGLIQNLSQQELQIIQQTDEFRSISIATGRRENESLFAFRKRLLQEERQLIDQNIKAEQTKIQNFRQGTEEYKKSSDQIAEYFKQLEQVNFRIIKNVAEQNKQIIEGQESVEKIIKRNRQLQIDLIGDEFDQARERARFNLEENLIEDESVKKARERANERVLLNQRIQESNDKVALAVQEANAALDQEIRSTDPASQRLARERISTATEARIAAEQERETLEQRSEELKKSSQRDEEIIKQSDTQKRLLRIQYYQQIGEINKSETEKEAQQLLDTQQKRFKIELDSLRGQSAARIALFEEQAAFELKFYEENAQRLFKGTDEQVKLQLEEIKIIIRQRTDEQIKRELEASKQLEDAERSNLESRKKLYQEFTQELLKIEGQNRLISLEVVTDELVSNAKFIEAGIKALRDRVKAANDEIGILRNANSRLRESLNEDDKVQLEANQNRLDALLKQRQSYLDGIDDLNAREEKIRREFEQLTLQFIDRGLDLINNQNDRISQLVFQNLGKQEDNFFNNLRNSLSKASSQAGLERKKQLQERLEDIDAAAKEEIDRLRQITEGLTTELRLIRDNQAIEFEIANEVRQRQLNEVDQKEKEVLSNTRLNAEERSKVETDFANQRLKIEEDYQNRRIAIIQKSTIIPSELIDRDVLTRSLEDIGASAEKSAQIFGDLDTITRQYQDALQQLTQRELDRTQELRDANERILIDTTISEAEKLRIIEENNNKIKAIEDDTNRAKINAQQRASDTIRAILEQVFGADKTDEIIKNALFAASNQIQIAEDAEKAVVKITKNAQEEKLKASIEYWSKEEQLAIDTAAKIGNAFNNLTANIGQLFNTLADNRQIALENIADQESLAIESQLQNQLDILNNNYQAQLQAAGSNAQLRAQIEETYNNNIQELRDQALADEQARQDALIVAQDDVAEKAFNVNKALQISQATITGAQAVIQSLAAAPPPFNAILASITGAAVAAQIAIILATKYQRRKTSAQTPQGVSNVFSSSSSSSISGGGANFFGGGEGTGFQAPQFFKIGQTGLPGDPLAEQKIYVSVEEIQNVGQRVAVIETRSRW